MPQMFPANGLQQLMPFKTANNKFADKFFYYVAKFTWI